MQNLLSMVSNMGKACTPLEADLRRITDAENIDAPPREVLKVVTNASHDADCRKEIMNHLREALSQTTNMARNWRRIHGGLVLLEHIVKNGSPTLIEEINKGWHFDPVQRVSFLANFEFADDLRVQNVIRHKAGILRKELLERMRKAEFEDEEQEESPKKAEFGGADKAAGVPSRGGKGRQPGKDSDSESSDDGRRGGRRGKPQAPAKSRQGGSDRPPIDDLLDFGEDSPAPTAKTAPPQQAPPVANLLDF